MAPNSALHRPAGERAGVRRIGFRMLPELSYPRMKRPWTRVVLTVVTLPAFIGCFPLHSGVWPRTLLTTHHPVSSTPHKVYAAVYRLPFGLPELFAVHTATSTGQIIISRRTKWDLAIVGPHGIPAYSTIFCAEFVDGPIAISSPVAPEPERTVEVTLVSGTVGVALVNETEVSAVGAVTATTCGYLLSRTPTYSR